MICPICRSEINEASICPECGFYLCTDETLNVEGFQQWRDTLVEAYQKEYWKRFPDFVVNGTRLINYTGSSSHVIVPKGIATIAREAFSSEFCDTSKIRKITLPDGLETIENNAFTYCYKLLEINIPRTVQKIGRWLLPIRQRCMVVCDTEYNPFERDREWLCYLPVTPQLEATSNGLYAIKNNAIVKWHNRWFYFNGEEMPERYYPIFKQELCVDYPSTSVELTLLSSYWPEDGDIEFEFLAENHTEEELSLRACVLISLPLTEAMYWTGDYEDYMYLKPGEVSYHKIAIADGEMSITIHPGESDNPHPASFDIFLNTEDEDDVDECFIELDVVRGAWEDE